MKIFKIVKESIITGAITFVVAAAVTFLYSLIAHGNGAVDWEYAIRFGIIFGIVFAWMKSRR
ncbi:MAG: hypothetical protein R6V02_01500 [Candidatus Aminicenantes bacterium]